MEGTYPKRDNFFFAGFLRLFDRCGAMHEVGEAGYWLVSHVVLTEDRRRYSGPVRFTNEMFCDRSGWSRGKLDRVRKRCVESGWLHYRAGAKNKPGEYWVEIPDHIEAGKFGFPVHQREESGEESGRNPGRNPGAKRAPLLPLPNTQESPTPTPRSVVVDLLKEAGVSRIEETIDAALSNGTDLDQMAAVCRYWSSRPGAWGPGALVKRLTSSSAPLLSRADGWPPPSSREQHALALQKHAEEREQRAANTERSDQMRSELIRLEELYGRQIDESDVDKLIQLLDAEGASAYIQQLRRKYGDWKDGRKRPVVRSALLRAMESQNDKEFS